MGRTGEINTFGVTQIAIGLSSIIGVTVVPGQLALTMKYLSGGTLEIIDGFSGVPTAGWGGGYPLGTNEIYNSDMTGTFFVAATGATVIAALIRGAAQ